MPSAPPVHDRAERDALRPSGRPAAGAAPLAAVKPLDGQIGPIRLLQTVVRNPLEILPRAVFAEGLVRTRFLGRENVFVCEPDLIGAVLNEEADVFIKAESMRRALEPALGHAILTAEGSHWRWQRRAVAPIFRHERLHAMVPLMLEAARRTHDRLSAGGEVDVTHEMMRTTFDIIVETMLSGRAGIDAGRVKQSITDYLEGTSWAFMFTLLRAPRWTPYPGQGRANRGRDYLRQTLLAVVAERRRAKDDRRDLATLLLRAGDPQTGRAMTDREIADNLLTFITAGHETTALALTWTLYLLAAFPNAAEDIRREIAAVAGSGPLAPEHVEHLGYTRQVLQEAMRLYPPAPIVVRTSTRDTVIGGQPFAAGTTVTVPIYAVQRHEALWEEPNRFDPARFAPERAKAQHRYAYLPFGAGPRICIGMGFAMLEAVAILATLVRDLQPVLRDGFVPALKMRVTLRPAAGMPMRFARVP